MERYRIYVLIIALYVFPSLCYAQSAKDPIVGTWKLISIEKVRITGEVLGPDSWFGKNPTGLLIYDTNGYFMINIMAHDEDVVEKYYAFFGTYEVKEKEGMILHRNQGSSRTAQATTEGWRLFKIIGNRLMLTIGEGRRLSFERVEKGK
jgi:hypothetical protein